MFLVLALDVAGVQVGFVRSHLELLRDPGFHLVGVAAELLQGVGLAELGALIDQGVLEQLPAEWRNQKCIIISILIFERAEYSIKS